MEADAGGAVDKTVPYHIPSLWDTGSGIGGERGEEKQPVSAGISASSLMSFRFHLVLFCGHATLKKHP